MLPIADHSAKVRAADDAIVATSAKIFRLLMGPLLAPIGLKPASCQRGPVG